LFRNHLKVPDSYQHDEDLRITISDEKHTKMRTKASSAFPFQAFADFKAAAEQLRGLAKRGDSDRNCEESAMA
jgi:hypothetical protein